MTIKRDINKLIPPKSRGKKRLAPLAGSRSIGASRGIGKLSAASSALVFTETSRSYYSTFRGLTSSDGLFVLRYRNVAMIVMGKAMFRYADYVPA